MEGPKLQSSKSRRG
ncbi:hypothetical protein LINPERPRIM_LOCUS5957 [Linum perenne]